MLKGSQETPTFVPDQLWTDTEDKVTALKSSSKLSEHFPNQRPLPTKVDTEMWIPRAEPGRNAPSLGTAIKETFSFSACALSVSVFYVSPRAFKLPCMKNNITVGRTSESVQLIVSTQQYIQ